MVKEENQSKRKLRFEVGALVDYNRWRSTGFFFSFFACVVMAKVYLKEAVTLCC